MCLKLSNQHLLLERKLVYANVLGRNNEIVLAGDIGKGLS